MLFSRADGPFYIAPWWIIAPSLFLFSFLFISFLAVRSLYYVDVCAEYYIDININGNRNHDGEEHPLSDAPDVYKL